MNVYIACYLFLTVLGLIYLIFRSFGKKITYFLGCMAILPLIVFRASTVGADTPAYCRAFVTVSNMRWADLFKMNWEPGLLLVMKAISTVFSNDERVYIFVFGLICLIPIYKQIWDNSDLPLVGLLVFYAIFFGVAEFINRQWISVLIIIGSLHYIIERKPFKFFFMILCAAFFHRSALVFAPMYFLYLIPLNNMTLLASVPMSVLLWAAGPYVRNILNYFARHELVSLNRGGLSLLVFLWISFAICYTFIRGDRKTKRDDLLLKMLLFAAVTQPFVFSFYLWSRVYYFIISLIFVLPRALYMLLYNNKTSNRVVAGIVILVFNILLFYQFAKDGFQPFIPMTFT